MKASAPNWSSFGTHLSDVMNEKPSSLKAGHAWRVVDTAINARIARTARPATRARPRNRRSAQTSRALPCVTDPAVRLVSGAERFAMRGSWLLDLVDLRDRLLGETARERCEPGVVGHALGRAEDVVQPTLDVRRL